MYHTLSLSEVRSELKALIRKNVDRGFLHYSACDRVCHEIMEIAEATKTLEDHMEAFEILLYLFIETIKLISYADTSSGTAVDAIRHCLTTIEEFCKRASIENHKLLLKSIIKVIHHKSLTDWAEYGYQLLRNSVFMIHDQKQAESVYALFSILGPMYGGEEYPDRYVITHDIIERLEGDEAARRYRTNNLDVSEIRIIAVKREKDAANYELAEELCVEALQNEKTYGKPSRWAYLLEQIYEESGDQSKQLEMIQLILKKGDSSYYSKLKGLYQSKGKWEHIRDSILDELAQVYMYHQYAGLLSREGELTRLLGVVQNNHDLIEYYGKQTAHVYPKETYAIYELYIMNIAAEATDRRKYKWVCKLIKQYAQAGAKDKAIDLIRGLIEKFPRRTAMQDELQTLLAKM